MVNESVNKLFETCGSEEKQNNLQIVTIYSNHYACAYTKFSRDSLKCASCGLYPCQYCHHLPYILAEIIHKPIWKCINNGENNMYQLGLQVKKKKAKGGESSIIIRYAVHLPQVGLLMQHYQLPIVDKPIGHLPSEILCRVIWEVSLIG